MQSTIRWGIWGTGVIADKVASDFRHAPGNAIHAVGSRSEERARSFAVKHSAPKFYAGLEALLADADVDVVYIATPNQLHLADSLACIEAGKAVLCEKPFALSAAQAQRIADAARAHNVFCMEAMWTRFIPAVVDAKRRVDAGELGTVNLLQGTFAHLTSAASDGRLFDPAMGGGVLLDLGVYLISLSHYLLGAPQSAAGTAKLASTGVDEQSSYRLEYVSGAVADLFASLRVRSANEFLIVGERGSLNLHGPFCAAQAFDLGKRKRTAPAQEQAGKGLQNSRGALVLRRILQPLLHKLQGRQTVRFPFPGHGYQFQLQEVERCLRSGERESHIMLLDDSIRVMRTMDELRAQWGLVYPNDLPITAEGQSPDARSIAYLVSQYPMLSMIFIIREVVQLRELGFRIDVASINRADRQREGMTATEATEADRTFVLKQQGVAGAAKAHVATLLHHGGGYLRGLALALRLSGLDVKRLAYNIVYLTEALMVGLWMERRALRHLHVHLGSQAATVGLYVKRVFGCGFSITVHGPDEFYDAGGQYLAEKVTAADFICCISFFARSQLMKLSPYEHWHKLEVSRLGVDPGVFTPPEPRAAGEVFEVLCVGRLTPAKGQHLLLDAAERLTQQGRRVRMRIVGHGQDAESLRRQVARLTDPACVVFEGAVNQDHIRALYAQADAFCIPSFAEGIPVVLMEAMAMGIPCVTTQITGIPELVHDGVSGLLVAPSDLEGLVTSIARLMDDPALCRRLGDAGRNQVTTEYDLAINVKKLAKIFARRIPS